ncbi:MAG: hypothetical protein IPL61_25600 [Myxococcales bacterium]|nr:hypothetical protein [Myxococcales bacterium]
MTLWTRGLVFALVATVGACGSSPAPAPSPPAASPAPPPSPPAARPAPPPSPPAARPAPAATERADCERVLAHTWQLIGGDPDSDKLRGARHERELAECMAHITPAARACVLAARTDDELAPCEALAR